MIDIELLKGSVAIYLTLSGGKLAQDGFLPRVNLDKALLDQTKEFYANKSKQILDSTNLIDYLKVAHRYYGEEQNRVDQILTWDVGQAVLKAFRSEMLIKPQDTLLKKGDGFSEFISQQRYDDIRLLYQLYKDEQDCLKPIGDQLRHYITE